MFAPMYLADKFGLGFRDTEQQNLVAVRGVLLLWLDGAEKGSRWYCDLSRSVNEINRILKVLGVADPSKAERPSQELFDHYLKTVSREWNWLALLAP